METSENVDLQKMRSKSEIRELENERKVQKIEKAENVEKSKKAKRTENSKTPKTSKRNSTGNVASQKRFVSAIKVFLTDAEKEKILAKVGNFKSISNYIRHHLGLTPNAVGRKRCYTKSALDLDMNEFEKIGKAEKSKRAEKTEKMEKTEKTEKSERTEKTGKSEKTDRTIYPPPAILNVPVKQADESEDIAKSEEDEIYAGGRQIGLWDSWDGQIKHG